MEQLADSVLCTINSEISHRRQDEEIAKRFVNKVLKEETFDLLDLYCTVVYYPLADEDNNGFHINGIPDKSKKEQSFVFINTAQTVEKQVFTAAHELGHIWEIDRIVAEKNGLQLNDAMSEDIINRFAAELLMPKTEFEDALLLNLNEQFIKGDQEIELKDFIKVIAQLMNQFLSPYKAVVIRLYELKWINEQGKSTLLGAGGLREIIDDILHTVFKENGYQHLLLPTEKKYIAGLAELLDQADEKNVLAKEKINSMRKLFELPQKKFDEKAKQALAIDRQQR